MKIFILLSLYAAALAYNDVADIDVDAVVTDPVETKKCLDCYLDKGPCTPVMATIKGECNFEAIEHEIQKLRFIVNELK